MVAHAYNPRTTEIEIEGLGVQNRLSYIESEDSLGYVQHCLKTKQRNQEKLISKQSTHLVICRQHASF